MQNSFGRSSALCLLLTLFPASFADDAQDAEYSSQYIDLSGEWNFKVYRKYSNMYQYMPYDMCEVTWEDPDTAQVPSADVYSAWEAVFCPAADYATGGLLQMYRGETPEENDRSILDENELFPNWSEAWFCKTVVIPEGFLKEESVTLLLGVIDDLDVVYVNGIPVAASGFIDENGQKAAPENIPADGGSSIMVHSVLRNPIGKYPENIRFPQNSSMKGKMNSASVSIITIHSVGSMIAPSQLLPPVTV